MNALISLHNWIFDLLNRQASWLMPTLARVIFAGVLLMYFWSSAATKLGPGLLGFLFPSDGAYIQIFPKAVEAAGYDTSQLGIFHWLVAVLATWGEFILPLMIVLGFMTRIAAIGMIIFVAVQTYVDINGHGIAAADIGHWFDRSSSSLIADQRSLWVLLFALLVVMGAGPFSLDRLFGRSTDEA
ncbi:MAG: DoxX family protein [Pseudomonadota bacterium]